MYLWHENCWKGKTHRVSWHVLKGVFHQNCPLCVWHVWTSGGCWENNRRTPKEVFSLAMLTVLFCLLAKITIQEWAMLQTSSYIYHWDMFIHTRPSQAFNVNNKTWGEGSHTRLMCNILTDSLFLPYRCRPTHIWPLHWWSWQWEHNK